MRQSNIAVVVVGYNRPDSLLRLLSSVANANYGSNVTIPLVISIDYSGSNDCKHIADAFDWKYGDKTIIHHPQNLGLKKHILSCGDLTVDYDAVIVLEDDLIVSSFFYDYAQQAFAYYQADDRIAGIALYHNMFNEVAYCPFEAIHDGYDNYFMQVPCSWGQLWTKRQWTGFVNYVAALNDAHVFDYLPATVQEWPTASSWKKLFYSYMLQTGKYFVYPRIGLSTNFGDAGQHLTSSETAFQTALLLAKKAFQFSTIDESLSLYDGFFEPAGIVYNKLVDPQKQVSFDLNGTKPLSSVTTKYLISSKKCSQPLQQFAVACYPYENNVLLDIQKQPMDKAYFSLGETTSFSNEQQFSRLPIDLKRIFLTDAFLRNAVRGEFEQSKEYLLGNFMLKPFRLVNFFLRNSNRS